jgi:CubicO group peptidase (beta-lactamase class C family)
MNHPTRFLRAVTLLALIGPVPCAVARQPLPPDAGRNAVASSLQPMLDQHLVAGAVTLVADRKEILSLETCGFANLEKQAPMQADHLFWIASMTKPMTATALMMLVDEGKVDIDQPVEKYLPEFRDQWLAVEKAADHVLLKKPQRPVTVKDLLTHTSGLASNLPPTGSALDVLTLAGAVVGYAVSPLQFEPGSKWQYCNPGINTLGRIVEVVSGMPFADFLQQRIMDPLGMTDTTFWPTEAQMKRLATPYRTNKEKTALEPTTLALFSQPFSNHARMAVPSGGLFSTAGDLAKFYQMVLNGGKSGGRQFLKPETLKRMTTNQTGDMKVSFTDGMHMGLGWHIVHEPQGATESLSPGSFGHGGAYGTQAWLDPERGLIMVLLIQNANFGNSDASEMRRAFQRAALTLANGRHEKP